MYGHYYSNSSPHLYRGLQVWGWILAFSVLIARYFLYDLCPLHPEDALLPIDRIWLLLAKGLLLFLTGISAYRLILHSLLLSPAARRVFGYLFPLLAVAMSPSLMQLAIMFIEVWMLRNLFDLYQRPNTVLSFNMGALFGAIVLLWPPMLYCLVALPFLMYLMRCVSWRTLVSFGLGLVALPFIVLPIVFSLSPEGLWPYFAALFEKAFSPSWFWCSFSFTGEWWSYAPVLLILLYLPGVFTLRVTYLDGQLRTRVRLSSLSTFVFIVLLLTVFNGKTYEGFFLLTVFPVTVLTAMMLMHTRALTCKILLAFLTLACVVLGLAPVVASFF